MKGDFSRSTFDPLKHYRSVRMQQGRVQLDADWNEQADLFGRRVESEAADLIGGCGGPLHDAAFGIAQGSQLELEPPIADVPDAFFLTPGRYYVDGILCENEKAVAFAEVPGQPAWKGQPDLPGLTFQKGTQLDSVLQKFAPLPGFDPAPSKTSTFIAYLDVWERHITALEDPGIREVALGGPDTATREKTVWQVKMLSVPDDTNCLSEKISAWTALTKARNCKLKARAEAEKEEGLCVVPATAGYRRLENQLYRVEIHRGGEAEQATFKWSRDDGFVVTRWLDKTDGDLALSVESSGRDTVLGFSAGDWVELTDDTRELWGLPGTLVKIARVEGNSLVMEDTQANRDLKLKDYPRKAKVRRWNHRAITETQTENGKAEQELEVDEGAVPLRERVWIKLEDGVQIWFEKSKTGKASYRTGDYWCIPARTAGPDAQSGTIEWPMDGKEPRPLAPHGIQHHYCRLAVVNFDPAPARRKTKWEVVQDCRRLFPPVTELTSLLYVGGDGQEVMPDLTNPGTQVELDSPLQVGVANGKWPVQGAPVKFKILEDPVSKQTPAGQLTGISGAGSGMGTPPVGTEILCLTGTDGIASCKWALDAHDSFPSQWVEARLLNVANVAGESLHLPIQFTANLSIASEVAYEPGDCPDLQGKTTVQEAIHALCEMDRGGGCEVTVGNQGKYPTIGEALDALLKKQNVICLCLLPGEHDLSGLAVLDRAKPGTHVKISACVAGVRALAKERITVQGLASFALRDLDISFLAPADPAALSFVRCSSLAIESCRIAGPTKSGGLLAIAGAQRVRLSGNVMQAVTGEGLKRAVGLASDLGLAALVRLYEEPDIWSFEKAVVEAAANLGRMGQAERPGLVRTLTSALAKLEDSGKVTPLERESYMRLVESLSAEKFDAMELAAALTDIRVAAIRTLPGIALVLGDAAASVDLESNHVQGILSLYGLTRFQLLKGPELDDLSGLLKDNVRIRPSRGVLHLRDNRIAYVFCSGDMVGQIREVMKARKGEIRGVFDSLFLTNTLVDGVGSQILSHHLALTSNRFAGFALGGQELVTRVAVAEAAVAISDHAAYVGNCGRGTTLRNVSRVSDKAANVELAIAP